MALAVKCDDPPVVWGICSLFNDIDNTTISVPFLIDTGADVTVIPETAWPPHWKLENAPMVGGVGGLSQARRSVRLIAITLHTEKRTRENYYPLPICHVRSPTPVGKGRSSPIKSQGNKFTVSATATHPLPPIRLMWKSSDPVWVEQWPLPAPRMDALLELVDRKLQ